MVKEKWKPIWAERERRAEKEAEAHPDAEGQLAESNGEQEVEAGKRISDEPTDKSLLPKFSDRLCSGVDQTFRKHTFCIFHHRYNWSEYKRRDFIMVLAHY